MLRLLQRQIRDLEHLMAALDREICRRSASLDQYLLTMPRLEPAAAPAIYAEIRDIRYVADSDQLAALVGVCWLSSGVNPGKPWAGRR